MWLQPSSRTEPLFKSLIVLKFNDLINYHILKFLLQWKSKTLPRCFDSYFTYRAETHDYHTRQVTNNNLYLKRKKADQYGKRSMQ